MCVQRKENCQRCCLQKMEHNNYVLLILPYYSHQHQQQAYELCSRPVIIMNTQKNKIRVCFAE